MEKVHVLKDESLGGVKREYVEVERRPKLGELINVFGHGFAREANGVFEVTSIADGPGEAIYRYKGGKYGTPYYGGKAFSVLEPSDIVIIGGKRYRIEERLAEPGEMVLNKKNGLTYVVDEQKGDFITVEDSVQFMTEESYVVLERVDKSTEDIIANLVRRVAELERSEKKHRDVIESMGLDISNLERLDAELFGEVTGIKRDIETWAQEVESIKHDMKPKQITLDVEVLAKLIGGVRG